MTGRGKKAAPNILLTLSKKLPDDLLCVLFPDMQPTEVRDFLRTAAKKIPATFLPRQQSLNFAPAKKKITKTTSLTKLTLFTDGASRGNPGKAGAGIHLLDKNGEEIAAKGFYLGECTNNMAEYKALILGLTEAKNFGNKEITIYLDSELIVRQLQGRYKVKDAKLKPLYAEVTELLADFKSYKVGHVPRKENQRADELANQGIDDRLPC